MSTLAAIRELGVHCVQCSNASSQNPGNFNYLVCFGAKNVSALYARKERSCPSCQLAADIISLRFPPLYFRPCCTLTHLNVYEICNFATSWFTCRWCDRRFRVTTSEWPITKSGMSNRHCAGCTLYWPSAAVQMSKYSCQVQEYLGLKLHLSFYGNSINWWNVTILSRVLVTKTRFWIGNRFIG
jgi:hypothetical protein